VSPEYGFCVTFPEKPSKLSDKNREGLPKHLWTVYRPDRKDFHSAQATSRIPEFSGTQWENQVSGCATPRLSFDYVYFDHKRCDAGDIRDTP
jgi:hypothetical protein